MLVHNFESYWCWKSDYHFFWDNLYKSDAWAFSRNCMGRSHLMAVKGGHVAVTWSTSRSFSCVFLGGHWRIQGGATGVTGAAARNVRAGT